MSRRRPSSGNRSGYHVAELPIDAATEALISRIQKLPGQRRSFSLHFFRAEAERLFAEGVAPIVEYYLQGDLGEYTSDLTRKYSRPLTALSLADIFRLNDRSFKYPDIKTDVKRLGFSVGNCLRAQQCNWERETIGSLKIIGWIREIFQIFPKKRPHFMPYIPSLEFDEVYKTYSAKRKELRKLWTECIDYVETHGQEDAEEDEQSSPMDQTWEIGPQAPTSHFSFRPLSPSHSVPRPLLPERDVPVMFRPPPSQSVPPPPPRDVPEMFRLPPSQSVPQRPAPPRDVPEMFRLPPSQSVSQRPPPPRDVPVPPPPRAEPWMQREISLPVTPLPALLPAQVHGGRSRVPDAASMAGAARKEVPQSSAIPQFLLDAVLPKVRPPAAAAPPPVYSSTTPMSLPCDPANAAFEPSFFPSVRNKITPVNPPLQPLNHVSQQTNPRTAPAKKIESSPVNKHYFIGLNDPSSKPNPATKHVVEPLPVKHDAEDPSLRLRDLEERLGALWKPSASKELIPGSWMD